MNSTFHEFYHPLSDTEEFMHQLTLQFPNNTEVKRIGLSAEGRDLFALTVSKPGDYVPSDNDGRKKKKKKRPHPLHKLNVVVVGAQHAREVGYIYLT